QGQVSGECYSGRWVDVGTPERRDAAERLLWRNI
ncbi:MAG TPA: mannose-1-phosphate guanylyltransferase, partial [Chromatiales bacterium]|nr:mannose-1-phosphate guanylyltransferase [Chromatiales bacterium]HEX22790.1 mannose-1-phosphate guanylyltransferase [Chromatiales bacterium]